MLGYGAGKLVVIAAITAVLFFFSLLVTDRIPEIPVNIALQAFFIPLTLVALLPKGAPSVAVAFGTGLGEAFGDILEGYEFDDPFGFAGYLVGLTVAGYIIGGRPLGAGRLACASVAAAALQAAIEVLSFPVVGGMPGLWVMAESWAGNALLNSVVGGLIPLLFVIPLLHGRIERSLGFAPKAAKRKEEKRGSRGTGNDQPGSPRKVGP